MVEAQKLLEQDRQNCLGARKNILESLPPNDIAFFSDEAHFHLFGRVNKQNFRYCSANNPQPVHEQVNRWTMNIFMASS